MFGYVTVNKPELKIKDYNRYRGYYCGLCKVLKERHGRIGQITLTYDMTFLVILLTSLYETKTEVMEERCLAHPTKKHLVLTNVITEYAADMNIALTYHNLLDDWKDEKSVKGLAGSKLFAHKYKRIEEKYPRQCQVIEETLKKLQEFESNHSQQVDEVAGCFGELMGELFLYQKDEWEDTLRKIGFYLGKFIYLMDAYEDVEKDIKNNSYNPLIEQSKQEGFEDASQQMLVMMLAECSNQMEKLPLIVDVELLRNIIYAGVWTKYDKLRQEKCTKERNNQNDTRSI